MSRVQSQEGDGELVCTNSEKTDGLRGGGWYTPNGGLRQRGRVYARGAARFVVERPVWQLALAVWLTHGVLDGVVTISIVAVLENTTVEGNSILRAHLTEAHMASIRQQSVVAYWRPLALKLGTVGVASLGIVTLERALPRRVVAGFAALLTAAGVVVVANNLLALRGVLG